MSTTSTTKPERDKRGRKPTHGKFQRDFITAQIGPELGSGLDALLNRVGGSKSELLREALRDLLAKHEAALARGERE